MKKQWMMIGVVALAALLIAKNTGFVFASRSADLTPRQAQVEKFQPEPGDDKGQREIHEHQAGHGTDDTLPAVAQPVTADDRGMKTELGDDRGRHGLDDAHLPEFELGDDKGGHGLDDRLHPERELGDDKGGHGLDDTTQPRLDDKGGQNTAPNLLPQAQPKPIDDKGGANKPAQPRDDRGRHGKDK